MLNMFYLKCERTSQKHLNILYSRGECVGQHELGIKESKKSTTTPILCQAQRLKNKMIKRQKYSCKCFVKSL